MGNRYSKADLQAACYGNGRIAELLAYLLREGEKEARRQKLGPDYTHVTIIRKHDDIQLSVRGVSERTRINYVNKLNEWGYITSQPYKSEYTLHLEVIDLAVANPPEPEIKPRGRYAKLIRGTSIPTPIPIQTQEQGEETHIVRLEIRRAQLLAELREIEQELAQTTSIVYGIVDPRDMAVFYVGISLDSKQRWKDHLRCSDENKEKNARIQDILDQGMTPIFIEIEEIRGRAHALEREQYWIRYFFSRGVHLTNIEGATS